MQFIFFTLNINTMQITHTKKIIYSDGSSACLMAMQDGNRVFHSIKITAKQMRELKNKGIPEEPTHDMRKTIKP